jgi:hypothetical protein
LGGERFGGLDVDAGRRTTNQGAIVSIDAESQKDLALNEEDADNVLGGQKKKKKQAHKPAAGAAPKMINVQVATTPVETGNVDSDCDPEDPGATNPAV